MTGFLPYGRQTIEDDDVAAPARRDPSKQIVDGVALGIEHQDALSSLDRLQRQVGE